MELSIYSIRDSKANAFLLPWFKKTEPEAVRAFAQLIKDPQSLVATFPEDFDLYETGKYSDVTGLVTPLETPRHIVKAVMLREV